MGKFSQIQKGTRLRKPIKLPLPGAQIDASTGEWVGPTMPLDVRIIRNDEHDTVLEQALAFAKKRGLENPEDGDPLYERGKLLYTLAVVCIDTESPEDDPKPFFDGGWEQIHTSDNLTPEVIAYLYHQWELFQDSVNPLAATLSKEAFLAATFKTAGGDMAFFVNSRPGTRWIFARTLASQLVASLAASSPYSGFSATASSQPTPTEA